MTRRPAILLPLVATIAGCAAHRDDFPSLAPRPIEKVSFAEPEVAALPAAPDPALDSQLAPLRSALADADDDFTKAAAQAASAVAAARNAAAGSERWIEAQTRLAVLDDDRARSADALAQVDRLVIERGTAGNPPYPALETLRDAARAQVAAEGARVSDLQSAIAAP